MASDGRGYEDNDSRGRPASSPVGVLHAALQAASNTRNFLSRQTSGNQSSSPSCSPERTMEHDIYTQAKRLPAAKLNKQVDSSGQSDKLKLLSNEGLLLDMHQLLRDASVTLDVFKGSLVVLMAASNVIITMSSAQLRSHSYASLVICNAASSLCFVGFLLSFGFSCYGQYLHEWPDPTKDLNTLRTRVLRAVAGPVIGAWACNFVWCFLCLKNEFTRTNLFDVFTFSRVFGSGPDFLCSFSLDLALVYLLWRPIMRLLDSAGKAEHGVGVVSRLSPENRRNLVAVAIALSPLLLTLVAVPDCTWNKRWVQWFLVCDKRDIDTPSLSALPHLTDFALGILAAACWHRFLADLRPFGDGGPSGGLSILPMQALRRWFLAVVATSMVLLVFFVPLGQVWLYTDLSVVQMSTPFGQLIRGFSNGPSMLWLLATLWPLAIWGGMVVVLVTLRGTMLGNILQWPLAWLEHLGANVLFYLVLTNVFLAGMFRGLSPVGPFPFTLPNCLFCTALLFLFGRFLHVICRSARK